MNVALTRKSIIDMEFKLFPLKALSLSRAEDFMGVEYICSTNITQGIILPEDMFLYKVKNKEKFIFAVKKYNLDFITVKDQC
jgi:hypothetical protein